MGESPGIILLPILELSVNFCYSKFATMRTRKYKSLSPTVPALRGGEGRAAKEMVPIKIKRVLPALLLALALILGAGPPCRAAGTELRINTPETVPKAGETFTVTVDISGNPGFSAVQFTIPFEKDVMTCTRASTGALLRGSLSATNNDAPEGAVIAAASAGPMKGDGQLAAFTFTAKRDLTRDDFRIREIVLSNEKGEDLAYTVQGATEEKSADPGPQVPSVPDGTEKAPEGTGEAKPSQEGKPTQGASDQAPAPAGKPEKPEAPGAKPEDPAETAKSRFTDMAGHWAAADVEKAAELGIIGGYEDGTFKPDASLTRAQFVTILYRQAGRPAVTGTTPFTDIANVNEEFRTAIAWAYGKKLVDGTGPDTFNPHGTLSRQATMKILFQHSGGAVGGEQMFYGVYDGSFPDSGSLAAWARTPVYWGVYNTLMEAGENGLLNPAAPMTRAGLARSMVRYIEKFGGEETT